MRSKFLYLFSLLFSIIIFSLPVRAADLEDLLDQLESKDPVKRYEAAVELGKLGDPGAIPALIEALSDEDKYVTYWAASSLGDLKAKEAVPALVENLSSPDEITRYWAAIALGKIEDLSAIEPLKEAYRKESIINTKIGMEIALDNLEWLRKQEELLSGGPAPTVKPTAPPTKTPVPSPTEEVPFETPLPSPTEEIPGETPLPSPTEEVGFETPVPTEIPGDTTPVPVTPVPEVTPSSQEVMASIEALEDDDPAIRKGAAFTLGKKIGRASCRERV